jgi:hypothetical protein
MPLISYTYSIPYLILFYILYINIIPVYKKNIKINTFYIYQKYIVIVVLILFFGFRGYVMIDWINYSRIYNNSPTLFDDINSIKEFLMPNRIINMNFEKGFLIYMIICKTLSPNYFFFQFISYVIDFTILYFFLKREIPGYIILGFVFFILFYGFQMKMHLLRNIKSILIFMISIKYIKERKFLNFFILNCFGALFHVTSFFFIPLYFILNKNIPSFILIVLFIIGNIIFLLRIEWVKVFLLFINFPGKIGHLVRAYLNSSRYSQSFGLSIGYIERTFSFLLVLFLSKKLIKVDKENIIFINLFYLYCFIYLYFSEMYIFIERVVKLFIFSYWIIYPKIYNLISKKIKYVFLIFLFLYGSLKLSLSYTRIFQLYDNILLPYKSYQERERDFRHFRFIESKNKILQD